MKKNIQNIIAINEVKWYNEPNTKEKLEELPLKIQWKLYKNMKALNPIVQSFNEFQESLVEQRNKKWFTEDNGKCEKIEENGKELLKVKEEFIKEFNEYNNALNLQVKDIITETTEVDLLEIKEIEDFIENLSDNTKLTIEDLEMLDFFTLQE